MIYKYRHPEYFEGVERPDFAKYSGNIVLYGAGFQAALTCHFLKKMNVHILALMDKNCKKHGTKLYGNEVLSPEICKARYPDAMVLVTPFNHQPAWEYVQNELGYTNVHTSFPFFLEIDIDEIVALDGLPEWFYTEMSMDNNTLRWHMDRYLRKVANAYNFPNTYLHGLELSISEVCNLRCKECNAFMPYYSNPKHFPLHEIKSALDKVLKNRVFEYLTIEGGETFIYPELLALLKYIRQYNVDNLVLLTNGAILPSDDVIAEIARLDVSIRFSYYGELSTKLPQFLDKCKRFGITNYVFKSNWSKFSQIRKSPHTESEISDIIEDCYKCLGRSGPYLRGGTLYRCPFAGNMESLDIIDKVESDSINLVGEDYAVLQERIEKFMLHPRAVFACKYCNGRGYTNQSVPVAEQLPKGVIPVLERIDL